MTGRERLHPKRRSHERDRPKVFVNAFNAGSHFDPYFDPKKDDLRAHEHGIETKHLHTMGERRKARVEEHDYQIQPASRAPVTLPSLKWMKP